MNIEEAKANIGKEVVVIGKKTPLNTNIYLVLKKVGLHDMVYAERKDGCYGEWIKVEEIALKHPTFKAGDQVVLDESTKPYTLTAGSGEPSERAGKLEDNRIYVVMGIAEDGDVNLVNCGWIQPRHLKLAPQKEVKPPKNDVVEFKPLFCNGLEQNHPRIKDVTNLLQKLDVAFLVDENEIAFTVKYGDNSFQVMKHDQDALLYSEALFIASSLGKSEEFNLITGKQTKACILLQNNGYKVNLTMRGIEVL